MERRTQRVRSPRAKCSFVQRGWWPQAARATAGEGRYDQILKCSERSTQQIRYRPTGPQAPWDRIRANADNRKASRTSLFERLGSQRRLRESLRGEDATVLLINIYRTSVSGVLRRKDSGFAVCGENLASVSQFVAGIRHSSRMPRSLCKSAPANEPEGNSAYQRGGGRVRRARSSPNAAPHCYLTDPEGGSRNAALRRGSGPPEKVFNELWKPSRGRLGARRGRKVLDDHKAVDLSLQVGV